MKTTKAAEPITFDQWCYLVCEAKAGNRDPHDIYPTLDLTDARYAFVDGQTPEQYAKSMSW